MNTQMDSDNMSFDCEYPPELVDFDRDVQSQQSMTLSDTSYLHQECYPINSNSVIPPPSYHSYSRQQMSQPMQVPSQAHLLHQQQLQQPPQYASSSYSWMDASVPYSDNSCHPLQPLIPQQRQQQLSCSVDSFNLHISHHQQQQQQQQRHPTTGTVPLRPQIQPAAHQNLKLQYSRSISPRTSSPMAYNRIRSQSSPTTPSPPLDRFEIKRGRPMALNDDNEDEKTRQKRIYARQYREQKRNDRKLLTKDFELSKDLIQRMLMFFSPIQLTAEQAHELQKFHHEFMLLNSQNHH